VVQRHPSLPAKVAATPWRWAKTPAGGRLNISQRAVRKRLQLFERNAGMALFTRDRGGLGLPDY